MKNLDWKKINNGKDFQRLVNDLFALEINNPAFLSSNPEIGPDGGWDGRYIGSYMNLSGVWSFQSKWTKHDLDGAYAPLSRKLKEELIKAKKNGVNYLLFATNADLRIGTDDHVRRLENLNSDGQYVKCLFVWPKANLENIIVRHLWLRHYYFNDCQEPMFVPPQAFDDTEVLLTGGLIERGEETRKLKEFISNEKSDVLIVHAAGGYGKTHFISNAGKTCYILNPSIQAWFCRPNIRDINDAINDELDHQKDTLIFLDDAERYPDDAKKLIAHVKTFSPGKLKVILSCRSSGKEIIKNLADSQRVDEYTELELPRLSEKGLIEVLVRSAGSKKVDHPERVVKELNGNLFLIVAIGKLIKGEGEIDPKSLKKRIKNDLEQEAINALNGLLDADKTKKLLRELSIIVPFQKDRHSDAVNNLSAILGLDAITLNDAIAKLLEGKILRIIGASIRFNPDMKGDIYLSVELDKENGEDLADRIFEDWLSACPETLAANLAAASRHSETDSAKKAVRRLVNKWIGKVSRSDDYSVHRRLEFIEPIAHLAPEEVIALIYSYIGTASTNGIFASNRDTYGPIIYQILHVPKLQKSVLHLVLFIANKDLKGPYHNYIPATLVRQLTSPLEISIELAIDSLSELLDWVKRETCTELEAKLASEGVKEALSGSHEYSESYENQMTIGRKILVYKDSHKTVVDRYRNKAMEILKEMLFHSNDKIKNIGIETIHGIGREATSTSDELWGRIISDKKQAIDWINKLINSTAPLEILSSIEDLLIEFWADNNIYQQLSAEAGKMLRDFPRSPEYIVFRYFMARNIIITNFNEIAIKAPDAERWTWLINNYSRYHNLRQEELESAVEQLSKRYNNKDEIIKYLNQLDMKAKTDRQWYDVPLIETWSKFNKEAFIGIAHEKGLLDLVPEMFHRGIHRIASDDDQEYTTAFADDILGDLNNLQVDKVDCLMDLIFRHKVPAKEFMPWFSKIMEKSNSHLKHMILHRAYIIFKDRGQEEKNKVIDILEMSLGEIIDSHMLDMFDFLLKNAVQWNLPEENLNKLRATLFGIIKNFESIDYHIDDLLKIVINGDLDKFIELVDYRLNKYKSWLRQKNGKRFDPIPFDGFRSSADLIKNYDDFSKIMDTIILWKNKDLLTLSDMNNLLKNLKKHDHKQGDYLKLYINDKIKKRGVGDLRTAISALYFVSFKDDTADLFLSVLLWAEKEAMLDEAKDVFSHKISSSYGWTTREAPRDLINKKEALTKIYDTCPPGVAKNFLNSLILSINKDT